VPDGVGVRVVIVDNDADGSAATVVDGWRSAMPWPIDYSIEARRGIPHARNRAVEVAGGCDAIAFVDDDEVPERAWLTELLRVRAATGAVVVTGPVIPELEGEPSPWLAPFFERPRFADGALIGYARTSNVLIDLEALPEDGPPFAPKLALTGGSDTHLFMRMVDRGAAIAWADHAVVHEAMPASRVNVGWLLRREYRRGNTLSLCLRDLHDTWPSRLKRLARAVVEVVLGVFDVVAGVVRGRASALRGGQRMMLAAGMVTGLLNVRYDEYAVIHGG
jgi:succinoglycan biosynthesis protein ExoM